jgi:NitT/TauT family transport system substrate-binding protein
MTHRLTLCSLATMAAAVALLCNAGGTSAQVKAEQLRTWRHAIIEPKGEAGFQVMAVRAGFAAKQGLKFELPAFQNDVISLRGLLAGELDSYEGGAATAIIAAARNADVKILGCHWQSVVHSVFARAELKGPQDLKGHTMAISAPNATPDMIARAYLAQNDVPEPAVKFASLGNDPERYKAVLSAVALATVVSIEFLPISDPSRIKLLARGSDLLPKYQRLCTVTTGKAIATRRSDIVGFLTAQMQGLRYALDHRDDEIAIAREITGMKAEDPRPAFMFEEAKNPATGVDPTYPLAMDKLEWLQDKLVKNGNMAQPYDLARVVNGDLRAEALARAGLQH